MKLARFTTDYYRVPRQLWLGSLPVRGSLYSISHIELVTCDLETADGVPGFGLTYTVGHGGSALHATLRDEIAPELLGHEIRSPAASWRELWFRLHWVGRGGVIAGAIAAADVALWDACARAQGLPLYEHLGAQRDAIAAYGSGVDLGYSLAELLDEVRSHRSAGFDAVKIKVGHSPAEDVERVRAVREEVGEGCALMVDANMAWSLAEAAQRLRALEAYRIDWLEEPLPAEDVEGHAALQRLTAVPLAAGESLFSLWEFASYLRAGAIRIAQPDVTRLGVTGWMKVAALAEAFHVPVAPHFVPDVHVHLACAVPNALYVEYLPWLEPLLASRLELEAGSARPSAAPGHGVVLDRELLEPYRIAAA
jgi:L-alanine-DL-glutamate epimerase-like enolase superfamily enzyme